MFATATAAAAFGQLSGHYLDLVVSRCVVEMAVAVGDRDV